MLLSLFKWDKMSEITGLTSIVISMNAFLLITILAFYKILQPEDPVALAQFRTQIRLVYLVSFLIGNVILLYIYKRDLNAINEEKEMKRKIREEKKRRKEERKKREIR